MEHYAELQKKYLDMVVAVVDKGVGYGKAGNKVRGGSIHVTRKEVYIESGAAIC